MEEERIVINFRCLKKEATTERWRMWSLSLVKAPYPLSFLCPWPLCFPFPFPINGYRKIRKEARSELWAPLPFPIRTCPRAIIGGQKMYRPLLRFTNCTPFCEHQYKSTRHQLNQHGAQKGLSQCIFPRLPRRGQRGQSSLPTALAFRTFGRFDESTSTVDDYPLCTASKLNSS